MKVLQINCSSTGSTGRISRSIHKKLLSDGHNSFFAYGYGPKCSEENTFRISNYFDIRIHGKISFFANLDGYFSSICTIALLKKINKIKPEIIHLHNLHGCYLNVFMLFNYIKSHDINVVFTLHDCWGFTAKCSHFAVDNCYKWKTECYQCPQVRLYLVHKHFDMSLKLFKDKKNAFTNLKNMTITTVSKWLALTTKESFLSKYPTEVVYNGIDINIYKPTPNDLRKRFNISDKFVILGVANYWDVRKGLKDFKKISQTIDNNYIIMLVGLNNEQIKSLPKNIIGIARTENQTELAELYSTADVFVNCSTEETFGMVTAEAMACGTPVIAYDSTACAEIVDVNTGFIIKPHDIKSIYDAIKKVNQKGKVYYSDNCRTKIVKKFSSEIMINNYMQLYEKILK
ncbi:MAG: glycosyltransferase [Clostridia bacterium]|jgi:glycosyltransferase involved in cell wall biosynthesis